MADKLQRTPDDRLVEAAAKGDHTAYAQAVQDGATGYDRALIAAAATGQLGMMGQARTSGATNYSAALRDAAASGEIQAMKVARTWGGKCPPEVIGTAAEHGSIEAMKLAWKWAGHGAHARIARRYYTTEVQHRAARAGQLDAMLQARHWGAKTTDETLKSAARGGHIEAMGLILSWGHSGPAAHAGPRRAMSARDIFAAYTAATIAEQREAMVWLRRRLFEARALEAPDRVPMMKVEQRVIRTVNSPVDVRPLNPNPLPEVEPSNVCASEPVEVRPPDPNPLPGIEPSKVIAHTRDDRWLMMSGLEALTALDHGEVVAIYGGVKQPAEILASFPPAARKVLGIDMS